MAPEVINTHLVYVFDVLHLTGAVGFALIIISALLSRANRHLIWFNFCVSWLAYCLSACILYFAGQTTNPGIKLCTVHAALAYSAPPLVAWTSLSLVIYLLLILRGLRPGEAIRYYAGPLLLIWPWLVWLGIFLSFMMRGVEHPEEVALSPAGTYCIISDGILTKITTTITVVALLSSALLEFVVIYILARSRREVMVGCSQTTTLVIRTATVVLFSVTLIVIGLLYTFSPGHSSIAEDIFLATIPPCSVVVFGTQTDLLRVWMFWKRGSDAGGASNWKPPEMGGV